MKNLNIKKVLMLYAAGLLMATAPFCTGRAQGELVSANGNVTLITGSAYYPASHASDGNPASRWVTDAPGGYPSDYFEHGPAPVMVLDLGADMWLDGTAFWGYGTTGLQMNSASEFSLRFATEADGPDGFGTSIVYNPTFHPINALNTLEQDFPFALIVRARYIELTVSDNYYDGVTAGGDRVGLADVSFNKVTPTKTWGPTPAYDAKNVATDVVLKWKSALAPSPSDPNTLIPNPDLVKHVIYISGGDPGDPNVYYLGEVPAGSPVQAQAQYGPVSLDRDKTYYWRVDEVTDTNTVKGDVWKFTTLPSTPIIAAETPADTAVYVGDDAVFTVSATNPFTGNASGLSYQWYKVTTGGDVAVGTDSATYTVTGATSSDDGQYYCVVKIAATGSSSTSRTAALLTKRLIGHWAFDGNLVDSIGGNDGSYTGTGSAHFDSGVVGGKALRFMPGDNPVTLPTSALSVKSWTLSWWDNSDPNNVGGSWETMVGNGAGPKGWEIFEFDRNPSYRYTFGFNIGGGYNRTPNDNSYPRGKWALHVVSYNPVTKTAIWYINGKAYHTFNGVNFTAFDTLFYIGNVRGLSQPYVGSIDDFRLYNYPLDAFEAAKLYTDVMGGTICVQYPQYDISGPDGVPDCVVDIYDLVGLASSWLESGIYPLE